MLLHQKKIEPVKNGFLIAQINFDLKIVGLETDLASATAAAAKVGNLGYPAFVIPITAGFIPEGQHWSQPNYK